VFYVLLDNLRATLDSWGIYWMFMVLDRLTFRALAAAVVAFGIVLAFGRPVIDWLRRKKIGDTGLTDAEALQRTNQSKASTPTMGGLLICGSIAASTLLLADFRNFYVVLALVTLVWLAALGSIDDWLKLTAASRPGGSRQGLHAWEKLVFQFGLGLMVGYFVFHHGDAQGTVHDLAHVLTLPLQSTYERGGQIAGSLIYLPVGVFVLLAVLMVAGMSNAVNITDGMDGLASGITVAVSLGLVVLTYIAGDQTVAQYLLMPYVANTDELVIFASAIAGACLGFLWFNCLPAQVFMGDTGSLALGGSLAYVAVVIRQEILLLVMSGVFLLEISSVVLQVGWFKYTRMRTGVGQRLFKVAPIHHHFHILGWRESQVVTRFWILACLLVVLALSLIKVR
jgi:phospho-N-acetylmuramoyl-pentapeptide-transferase